MKRTMILLFCCISIAARSFSSGLELRQWRVDDVSRKALVHMPKGGMSAPLVFVFHGHGGNMQGAARQFSLHEHWPEAVVVYMQGLPTPVPKFDPDGKRSGWQILPHTGGDRDLKFVDAVVTSLQGQYDPDRVYCTGHSNGGRFIYLLWAERENLFTAVAASGCPNELPLNAFSPKPVMHVAGKKDRQFALQKEAIKMVREVNGCRSKGIPWHSKGEIVGTLYPSASKTPFVSLIYPGGHKLPQEVPEMIVRFFQEHRGK